MTTSPGSAEVRAVPNRSRSWYPIDLLGLAALTTLFRLPAFFSARHLTFDDGVFASSILAMREGGVPFDTVFSSQGPLFLPLAYLGDLLAGHSINGPRVLAVASGVGVVLAVYWCATYVTDRYGALVAGILTATSGALMWVTGPLAADGPALAFAALTMGLALRHRDNPRISSAIALGLAVGATLSTKAVEAPILIPVGLVLMAPLVGSRGAGRWRIPAIQGILAAISAAAVFLSLSLAFGFSDVWDQSFTYRTEAAVDRDPLGNAAKIFSTLWDRDLVLLLFSAVTLVAAVVSYRRKGAAATISEPSDSGASGWRPSSQLLIWSWVVFTYVWLVFMVSPLWRPHVSAIVPPLALLIGIYRPPWRVAAVAAVVSVPLLWIQLDGIRNPGDYRGGEAEVVAALRELPDGAWGLSDEPGLLWRSDIRTTDDMVDPSMLRVQQGRYDEDTLILAATDQRVCAVVVRSDQRFGSFGGLGERLRDLGYEATMTDATAGGVGPEVLYTRTACSPVSPD